MVTGCTQVLKMVLLESGIYGELFKPNILYHFLSCKPIYLTCSSSENLKKMSLTRGQSSADQSPGAIIHAHNMVLVCFKRTKS